MKINDRVKTTAYLPIISDDDYLFGKIINIKNEKCFDSSNFKKIIVMFDDGRVLPCIEEELEIVKDNVL